MCGPSAALAQLDAALDALTTADLTELDDRGQADLVQCLARAKSRLMAVECRALREVDAAKTAHRSGAASTGAWAARLTNTDSAHAARQMSLACGLAENTATDQALAHGQISAEHAAVIVDTNKKLPTELSDIERRRVETRLLTKAQRLTPHRLRQAARRALEDIRPTDVVDAHENQQLVDEEEAALARTRLTLHENTDGTTSGHFTVPTLAGGILKKILDTMCAPRRQAMREQAIDFDGATDWARLRGLAFVELLEHLPTDHLHNTVASTVVVTIDHAALKTALRAAGTDLDHTISAGDARRMACNAGILPAVLNGASVPIDLGRSRRLFSEPQRIALAANHSTCAAQGCERPYAWCELHHQVPWSKNGPTNIKNAVPLCAWHHRQIHQHPERIKVRRT